MIPVLYARDSAVMKAADNRSCMWLGRLTAKRHAHDMRLPPAQVIHESPHISGHDARLVRRQVLGNAAAANASIIKRAAPAQQRLIHSGPLPQ